MAGAPLACALVRHRALRCSHDFSSTWLAISSTLSIAVNLDQPNQPMAPPPPPRLTGRVYTADEACALLGVRKATLYAYVSRGLLTALPDANHPKQSRYPAYEIEVMLRQRTERRRPPPEPQAALLDGWPLIDTQLTGIVDGRMVMRGQELLQWAQHASLEDTAALLWQVDQAAAFGPPAPVASAEWLSLAQQLRDSPAQHRAATLWSLAMPQLEGGHWLQGEALAKALGEHLRMAVACFLGQAPSSAPIHLQVAQTWKVPKAHHDKLRQALVLMADNVTNLMSLSARMLASIQGSLGACVLASISFGFARFSGGEFEAVEALFDEVQANGNAAAVAASRRSRGDTLPGFNHGYFASGDPRGSGLLMLATAAGSPAADWAQQMRGEFPLNPSIDWGVVALRRALKAPRDGGLNLCHISRTVGNLAQALEQRGVGQRMSVQSRYLGPLPH
ncbi:MAG: excisionase [Ideonella sp. MAG2]|nr:MAG: excisionase [Ideonella sp. MAG2]